ncbi:MAG: tetratricopeptide repeat protein [Nitrospirae bacterium]|jgi:tetratricopeptide (TPR) repeat protein|nr:tetratricopeptide repeat protein [Nitrospirota bacterium]
MNLDKAFQIAYNFYKNGEIQKAEYGFRKLLEKKPNHAESLRFLGIILLQTKKYESAIDVIQKDIKLNPKNADSYNNLGLSFFGLKQYDKAIELFNKAIKLDPSHFHAYYNLGNSFKSLNKFDDAIECYKKSLSINPQFIEAHNNLGDVYQEKELFDEAIQSYKNALNINSNFGNIYNNLGLALFKKGLYDEALGYFKKALELNPQLADAYNNIGNYFFNKNEIDQAINYYLKALKLEQNFATYNNLGNAFKEKGLLEEAIKFYEKALNFNQNAVNTAIDLGNLIRKKGKLDEAICFFQNLIDKNPQNPVVYINMAVIFQEKGLLDEAFKYYNKALEINPNVAEGYNNLALAFIEKGLYEEALSNLEKSLQLKPSLASAHFNLAMLLLLKNNFSKGWEEYEWRWKTSDFKSIKFNYSQPLWDGSDKNGRIILLHAEQGLGDTIHFMRYIKLVIEKNMEVIFRCPKELISLAKYSFPEVKIIPFEESLPDFEVHCPLMSLPLILKTTIDSIPAQIPYISVDSSLINFWTEKIKDNSNLKIGIAWSGNPKYKRDKQRSCSLKNFLEILKIKPISFYSLQKGSGSEQVKELPEEINLIDFTEEIKDFSDTAAIIQNLDLIISVDTAVAHLAGAMGKPVWTMLPFVPDWRWMLDREDSPWYPTMRLFRQQSIDNWNSVIIRIKKELEAILFKSF